jgi:hypothetical protein
MPLLAMLYVRQTNLKSIAPCRAGNNAMNDEATYVCDSCGEEIVVPIDVSAGSSQEYVEDCPVCCRPNVIHIEVDEDGDVRVWAARE